MCRLSVVIPVYNAEKTIESLCNTLINMYGATFELEIILVNDNSRDSTHVICQRLHNVHREMITYIRLAKNFGEHCAVMAGLNHVTGDYAVVMDDDFQNPPEEISRLVTEINEGYDVVYTHYPVKRDSLFRNLGSSINDKMANVILQKPADLYLSSFKIMNRFLVNEIIKYTGPDPYIDAIIFRVTDNIGKIQVRHDKRRHGRSNYTIGKLISLWGNMVVSYSLIPLRVLGFIGFIMTIIGVYIGGSSLLDAMLPHREDPTEYETLIALTAFFRGFQLLAVSIVGEYVGRIYLSLNCDPQYVIRERFAAQKKLQVATPLKESCNG